MYILLERGDKVIATARSLEKIRDFPKSENLRIQQLDVTDGVEAIKKKVDEAVTWFGHIDVLVNNAGVGIHAIVEEGGYVASHPFLPHARASAHFTWFLYTQVRTI